jgi:hypothetical protein
MAQALCIFGSNPLTASHYHGNLITLLHVCVNARWKSNALAKATAGAANSVSPPDLLRHEDANAKAGDVPPSCVDGAQHSITNARRPAWL